MMTGHQAGTGRRADRAGGIEIGHFHSLFGHSINIWSLKLFLAKTGKVSVPCIIDHDVDKVRLLRRSKNNHEAINKNRNNNLFHKISYH